MKAKNMGEVKDDLTIKGLKKELSEIRDKNIILIKDYFLLLEAKSKIEVV